jgi:hypothetical protein
MNTETVTPKHPGGRPKNAPPPTTSAEVRAMMAEQVVKASPDKDRCRFLSELLVSYEKVEERAAATTATESAALAAANTELVMLREQVAKVPGLEEELAALKADLDVRIATMRVELTRESMQTLALAARERNTTESRLREAEQKFASSGLEALVDGTRGLVREYKIPAPDVWLLPANTSPWYLSLWDEWPIKKATIFLALRRWTEDTPEFRAAALRIFIAALPVYDGSASEPIPDLGIRVECFTELARKYGCLAAIQDQVDAVSGSRWGAHQEEQLYRLQQQQIELARHQGAGRSPIGVAEQSQAMKGYDGPHEIGCECGGPHCLPRPSRFGLSIPTGVREVPAQDVNEARPLTGNEEMM